MSLLACCPVEPYLGMDPDCPKDAVICLTHSPHTSPNGVLHNILPLSQFRRTVNELKFEMADKVTSLTDQYSSFMDRLMQEMADLKTSKVIELGTLWLRELSETEEEYEELKRVFRNDFEGFSCRQIHRFYEKVSHTNKIQKQSLDKIPCYSQICKVMDSLMNSPKATMLIMEKIANLEGVLEKGQLLKKALPNKALQKENIKEMLLEANSNFDVRYNRAELHQNSSSYISLFSKYQLVPNSSYYINVKSKYTNVMVGLCKNRVTEKKSECDLHYDENSLAYNCSNGCIYREGLFESGPNCLTKGMKEIDLVLQVTSSEMLLLLGKRLICRTSLKGLADSALYLHTLMRTKGDSIEISMDQSSGLYYPEFEPSETSQLILESKEEVYYPEKSFEIQKDENTTKARQFNRISFGSPAQNAQPQNIENCPLYESMSGESIPMLGRLQSRDENDSRGKPKLFQSIEQRFMAQSDHSRQNDRNDKSKIMIAMDSSIIDDDDRRSKYLPTNRLKQTDLNSEWL